MHSNPEITCVEIRKASNGFVLTCWQSETAYAGARAEYQTYVARGIEECAIVLSEILKSRVLAETCFIKPARDGS